MQFLERLIVYALAFGGICALFWVIRYQGVPVFRQLMGGGSRARLKEAAKRKTDAELDLEATKLEIEAGKLEIQREAVMQKAYDEEIAKLEAEPKHRVSAKPRVAEERVVELEEEASADARRETNQDQRK